MDLTKGKNPQKDYMKKICKLIYYLGVGDCWFEDRSLTKLQQNLYLIWSFISYTYIFSFVINEFLAHCRSDLNDKEKNDLVQFTLAHSLLVAKILLTFFGKKSISKVFSRFLEGTRSAFMSEDLDKACIKRSMRLCVAVLGISYVTLLSSTFDGIRVHFVEGIPIRTEVTFYPSASDSGLAVNVLRFFIQFHWWVIVSMMASIDCLCITSLVIVGYKFKVLQVYFYGLRQKVLDNHKNKSRKEMEDIFRKDFVVGIQMHDDALWCAKNVQRVLGNLYSVQIFESVILLVMCLIKLVTVERNLVFLLANSAYIACLILLTGAYMMPAGDITHEASLVSMSMFHSGWELVSSRELRVLAVLALQRSQVPVSMNAFGVLTLSYRNFISVIRSSYSFFAVMY